MWDELSSLAWWGCPALMVLERIKKNHIFSFRWKLGFGNCSDL
jgi:hypothetical protein